MKENSMSNYPIDKTSYFGDTGLFSEKYRKAELGRLYLIEKVKDLEERIKALEASLTDAKERAIDAEEKIRKIEEALNG